MMEPAERVRRLLAAARPIRDGDSDLGREARAALETSGRLSAPGVDLALREHLEVEPSASELTSLLRWADPGRARRCVIQLAGNVCTAALRALALGLATAPEVTVRPSRRDPALARLLVREGRRAGLSLELTDRLEARPDDAVHLYGSDASIAAAAARLPPRASMRAFGTGIGIALARGPEDARLLADDLVPFDGAGCLSPRLVVAERGAELARALHEELDRRGRAVPRAPLDEADRAALVRAGLAYRAAGDFFEGDHHAVALDPDPRAMMLLPPLRATVVLTMPADRLAAWLGNAARKITCVGDAGVEAAPLPGARLVPLGRMQRPPLDGPVDLRRS